MMLFDLMSNIAIERKNGKDSSHSFSWLIPMCIFYFLIDTFFYVDSKCRRLEAVIISTLLFNPVSRVVESEDFLGFRLLTPAVLKNRLILQQF